jgi:hypothetical protein
MLKILIIIIKKEPEIEMSECLYHRLCIIITDYTPIQLFLNFIISFLFCYFKNESFNNSI